MLKKILFLLFTVISAQLMATHYTVSVKGTIADTVGDGVPGVKVEITAKTYWGSLIYNNTVLTDRLGKFSDSFITNIPGYVRITASDESFGTVDTLMTFSMNQPAILALLEVIRGADPCVASFNWIPSQQTNGQIDFTNTSSGGYTRIVYDFGDGTIDTTANPSHIFSPGNHQVCLTISNPSGCFDKRCETITVADPITCEVEFTYSQTTGYEVVLQATTTSSLATDFTWFLGAGLQTTGKTVTHNFPAPGIYTITVQAIDESGCEDSQTGQIEVVEIISPCQAAFRFIPDPQNPNFFHFTDGSTGAVQTWRWSFGDGNTSTAQNPHHLFEETGQYTVSLVIENQATGCNDSVSMPVDVGLGYYFTIAGQVFAGGFPADSSLVDVYRLNDGIPVFAGSFTSGPYGIFHFYALTQGIYILKAGLKTTSPDYGKYLTTYYPQEAFWENARRINLTADSTAIAFHLMPNPDLTTGQGAISGHIFYQLSGSMRSDIPAGYVPILLYNADRNPIHGVFSLEDGFFEFKDVPEGNWNLQPEITGVSIDPMDLIINSNNQNQNNLIVKVEETGVTFGIGINESAPTFTSGLPYPNPVADQWHIDIDAIGPNIATIRMYSADNRLVSVENRPLQSGNNKLTFNAAEHSSGAYFIVIQTEGSNPVSHKLFLK